MRLEAAMGGPDPLIEFCLATDKKFQKGCATGLHLEHYDSVSALQSKYELFCVFNFLW